MALPLPLMTVAFWGGILLVVSIAFQVRLLLYPRAREILTARINDRLSTTWFSPHFAAYLDLC